MEWLEIFLGGGWVEEERLLMRESRDQPDRANQETEKPSPVFFLMLDGAGR